MSKKHEKNRKKYLTNSRVHDKLSKLLKNREWTIKVASLRRLSKKRKVKKLEKSAWQTENDMIEYQSCQSTEHFEKNIEQKSLKKSKKVLDKRNNLW